MLRRAQAIKIDQEDMPQSAPAPDAATTSFLHGGAVGDMQADLERAFTMRPSGSPADRRRGERRGMDALRYEALQSVISQVEDRNFGGLREKVSWTRGLKPSRLVLLGVAIVAGGFAAFLATQRQEPAPEPVETVVTEVVAAPTKQVLVARDPIRVGQRLTASTVQWIDWPESAVAAEFITSERVPDADTFMEGSVARYEFFAGEPIREQKLVKSDRGYLSAILDDGMRGVSVPITAESASGGFVLPNDHVDVVMTRVTDGGQSSQTILQNVRVLAINAQLGEPEASGTPDAPAVFTGAAIATLALDPTQAELIIGATSMGSLSLVLRSVSDMEDPEAARRRATNQAIRLTSPFWKQ
jgi:pilus assembly protein CpaB